MKQINVLLTHLKHAQYIGLFVIHIFFINHLFAYQFDKFNINEGLSSSSVTGIVQDHTGFLWISTYHGLNRYDGYEFKIYQHQIGDSLSLSNNGIHTIYLDKKGNIWLGTLNGGLNRYDHTLDRFFSFTHDIDNPHSISHDNIKAIHEDSKGHIWLGTWGGGLNCFHPETGQFYHYQYMTETGSSQKKPIDKISSIWVDDKDQIWIASTEGVFLFNPQSETWQSFDFGDQHPDKLINHDISAIFIDDNGIVWIGTWGSGIMRILPGSNKISQFPEKKWRSFYQEPCYIWSISQDQNGQIWAGTMARGLWKLSPGNDHIEEIQNSPADLLSLSNNAVMCIFQDKSNMLWIGTLYGGLNKLNLHKLHFNHHYNKLFDENSLSDNVVHCILEDHENKVWIGTEAGGLNLFDPERNQYTHFRNNQKNPNSLASNVVRCIFEDHNRNLWIGTDRGLSQYHSDTGRFTNFLSNPDDPESLSHNLVYSLSEDSTGNLWIGTFNNGLNRFDSTNNKFIHYKFDINDPYSLSNDIIQVMLCDSRGRLWVGTYDGLNLYIPERDHFIRYQQYGNDNNALSSGRITSLFEDSHGHLWIGTDSGINQMIENDDGEMIRFEHFTVDDGLASNMVAGILEDKNGLLWISTANGITRLNPQTDVVHNYKKEDGLQSNAFNINCCFYSKKSGKMYFGGFNGFNVFHPDSISQDSHAPPVVLSEFNLLNQPVGVQEVREGRVLLEKSLMQTDLIKLKYSDNTFSFKFAALHFAAPQYNQYAYRMEGFENHWNYVGTKHEANYTNLDPGLYTFRVKASNNHNVWNEDGASIKIRISPPFYKTIPFRIFSLLIFILSILFIHKLRVHSLKKRQTQLENEVRERTKALKQSNQELEQFAYVASHDLQEPLRMVVSYLQLLERRYSKELDETANEFIDFAVDGAMRMQKLIQDLLSYSRISTAGKSFEKVDLKTVMEHVVLNLQVIIEEKKANVKISDMPKVCGDDVQLERLLQNLIGNGLKYCQDDVTPEITVQSKKNDNEWQISVSDNGIGIPDNQYERIFQIFQRLHSRDEYSGTGIGLSSCKKIVERHEGRIWVESQEGKGSTFYFTLPVREVESC